MTRNLLGSLAFSTNSLAGQKLLAKNEVTDSNLLRLFNEHLVQKCFGFAAIRLKYWVHFLSFSTSSCACELVSTYAANDHLIDSARSPKTPKPFPTCAMARLGGLVLLVACALLGSRVSTLLFANAPQQGLRRVATRAVDPRDEGLVLIKPEESGKVWMKTLVDFQTAKTINFYEDSLIAGPLLWLQRYSPVFDSEFWHCRHTYLYIVYMLI